MGAGAEDVRRRTSGCLAEASAHPETQGNRLTIDMAIPSAFWLQQVRGDRQIFVETGTHRGDGVQAALNAGFPCIHSVEVNPVDYGWSMHRFWHHRDRVHLVHGDSRMFLRKLAPTLTTKAVFWLDAHYCASGGGSVEDCPLVDELRAIMAHGLLDVHTIMVDDARYLRDGTEGFPSEIALRKMLLRFNPCYTFQLHDSRDFKQDIFVATAKRGRRTEA